MCELPGRMRCQGPHHVELARLLGMPAAYTPPTRILATVRACMSCRSFLTQVLRRCKGGGTAAVPAPLHVQRLQR